MDTEYMLHYCVELLISERAFGGWNDCPYLGIWMHDRSNERERRSGWMDGWHVLY